jgi:hypothetical protein
MRKEGNRIELQLQRILEKNSAVEHCQMIFSTLGVLEFLQEGELLHLMMKLIQSAIHQLLTAMEQKEGNHKYQ